MANISIKFDVSLKILPLTIIFLFVYILCVYGLTSTVCVVQCGDEALFTSTHPTVALTVVGHTVIVVITDLFDFT